MNVADKTVGASGIDLFFPLQFNDALPDLFPSPFEVRPHAVAEQAAASLKQRLPDLCGNRHPFEASDGGKMFGVLVVKNSHDETGYLSAFSGMLEQGWNNDGFVPPVFDQKQRDALLTDGEQQLADLTNAISKLQSDEQYVHDLKLLSKLDSDAEDDLKRLKEEHAAKKARRHSVREKPDTDESELRVLANESRSDKMELKRLTGKLAQASVELRTRVEKFQHQTDALKKQRKKQSRNLQVKLFEGYRLCDTNSSITSISELFEGVMPPSGAGDCAAVKLVQYANLNKLQPVALAEFWWGAPPAGGLRKNGRYYPACRSRCRVLLPHMLTGLSIVTPKHEQAVRYTSEYPKVLYEDDDIVLVEKPVDLLSVPGKVLTDSVETRLKARYPHVNGVMLLHRLDQATSGVMIAAKHARAYKSLQHQFQNRTIKKRYIAVLDGLLTNDEGSVELPLRLDYYDRPRQMVCSERGKQALTHYEVISKGSQTTRIAFYPHTGRTHQLRVHAAHADGLNCPIRGDELYGQPLDRLYLHAEEISFDHPGTGCRMTIASPVGF